MTHEEFKELTAEATKLLQPILRKFDEVNDGSYKTFSIQLVASYEMYVCTTAYKEPSNTECNYYRSNSQGGNVSYDFEDGKELPA